MVSLISIFGCALGECRDRVRHEIFRGRDRAEMHRAAGPARKQIKRALAVRDRGFDALGERQHLLASLRQQHAVAGPLHQRQAGEILKLPELLGHGRLGQPELGRGRGDAALGRERRKRAELPDRQMPELGRRMAGPL